MEDVLITLLFRVPTGGSLFRLQDNSAVRLLDTYDPLQLLRCRPEPSQPLLDFVIDPVLAAHRKYLVWINVNLRPDTLAKLLDFRF